MCVMQILYLDMFLQVTVLQMFTFCCNSFVSVTYPPRPCVFLLTLKKENKVLCSPDHSSDDIGFVIRTDHPPTALSCRLCMRSVNAHNKMSQIHIMERFLYFVMVKKN